MNNNWDKIRNFGSEFKGLTTIGVTDIVGSAIIAIFWFYMANLLGAEQYGKVSYFLAIGGLTSTLSLMGGTNMLLVYPPKNIKIETPVFLISIVTAVISSGVLFVLFHDIGTSVYSFGAVIFGLATSEILGKKLYSSYTKYFVTQKVLTIALGIGFYFIIGWEGVIIGIAIAFFPYAGRIVKGFRDSKLDFTLVKTRIGFMINSYILNISSAFSGSIDKLIVAPVLGYTILGNYQLGLQVLSILQIPLTIIYKYTLPHDASGTPNINLKKITIVASVIFSILGVLLSPLIIPKIFPKYVGVIDVIQIVSLSLIPSAIGMAFHSKFLGAEKSKIILAGSMIYITTEIISIILLGLNYKLRGVASALVLAGTTEAIFYICVNHKMKKK